MPEYIKNAQGILVPRFPSNGPRPADTPGVGFGPDKTKRVFTGGVKNPAFQLTGVHLNALDAHIHGRIAAAARVMTGIAFLRASSWVKENEVVIASKAVYQDARGTTAFPRAHRFPCSPKIGIWDPPQIGRFRSVPLGGKLREPYAITDFLPRVFNYADQLFEEGGALQTVEHAVRFALGEQPGGKTVNPNLVRHSVTHILIPGFRRAYEHAHEVAMSKRNPLVPDVSIFDPNYVKIMTDASLTAEYNEERPLLDIESVQDILAFSKSSARSFVPMEASAHEVTREVESMAAMVKSF
jgi:hypothetical protein